MSELYIAVQVGVYRHDVVAVCDKLELAQKLARDAIEVESDHYHSVEIVARQLNGAGPERLLGTFTPKIREKRFNQAECRWESTLVGIEWSAAE